MSVADVRERVLSVAKMINAAKNEARAMSFGQIPDPWNPRLRDANIALRMLLNCCEDVIAWMLEVLAEAEREMECAKAD